MSNSEASDVVATNDNKIGYSGVFMEEQYDSIISINRNQLENLSNDRKDVPNDFSQHTFDWFFRKKKTK